MIHLWKIDGDDFILNLEQIFQYDLLKEIYQRDHTVEKSMAHKEFKYINFLADKEGYIHKNGLNKFNAHIYACKHSNLDEKYNPDIKVQKAIKLVLSEINSTVVEDCIDETIGALSHSTTIVKKVRNFLDDKIDKADSNEAIEDAFKLIKQLINISNDIPTYIKKLSELKVMYTIEKAGVDAIRGGAEYSESYDGTGDIESLSSDGIERLD